CRPSLPSGQLFSASNHPVNFVSSPALTSVLPGWVLDRRNVKRLSALPPFLARSILRLLLSSSVNVICAALGAPAAWQALQSLIKGAMSALKALRAGSHTADSPPPS